MAFKDRIALLKIKQGNGTSPDEVIESKLIWANISDISTNTKINAEINGMESSLQALTYRSGNEVYTHADYKGDRYKIEKTGKAKNDLHIILTLARIK